MERQAVAGVDLIEPHGGELKHLYVADSERAGCARRACEMPSWDLTPRQLGDIELLLNGGFSPLEGFMCRADYESVVERLRLADGTLWPTPILLDVTERFAENLSLGGQVALRDPEGILIAILEIKEIWSPSLKNEPESIAGAELPNGWTRDWPMPVCLGGNLHGIEAPVHYDFRHLRAAPRQIRDRLALLGRRRVLAYRTIHPMQRFQVEAISRLGADLNATLLIQPVLRACRPGASDYFGLVRCHERIMGRYPANSAILNLLPLSHPLSATRELLMQTILARNFGCTDFIFDAEPDSVECPKDLLEGYRRELGVEMVESDSLPVRRLPTATLGKSNDFEGVTGGSAFDPLTFSAGDVMASLQASQSISDCYYPEVLDELRHMYPPLYKKGFVIFFTGLSGSGKSTVANAVKSKLLETERRKITLLDGDHVRKHLSSELGFSKEHRDINVLRIGFVASEIAKHGGIAICAPIAPYAEIRHSVREMVESVGGFVEVHVTTSLEICEERDRKGLYAKARAGLLKGFTGIDDPYEVPVAPELRIDTAGCAPDEAADQVLQRLAKLGYIRPFQKETSESEYQSERSRIERDQSGLVGEPAASHR